jgi:hypothetical protein
LSSISQELTSSSIEIRSITTLELPVTPSLTATATPDESVQSFTIASSDNQETPTITAMSQAEETPTSEASFTLDSSVLSISASASATTEASFTLSSSVLSIGASASTTSEASSGPSSGPSSAAIPPDDNRTTVPMSPGGLGGTIIGCIIGGGVLAGMFIWFFIRRRETRDHAKPGDEESGDNTRDIHNNSNVDEYGNAPLSQGNGDGNTNGNDRTPGDQDNDSHLDGGIANIGPSKGRNWDNDESDADASAASSQIVDENNDPVPYKPKGKDKADIDTLSSDSDPEREDDKIEVDKEYFHLNRP